MRRRTALELATTGLLGIAGAGCLGVGGNPTNGDGTEETLYTVSVAVTEESPAEKLPLELDFAVGRETITEDDPFEIEFELRNEGDEPIEVSSGAPWPFGVLWMERKDAPDEPGVTLWTDAYEGSSHVGTEGRRVTWVQDIGLVEDVAGGESVADTYELHGDTPGLAPETYRFSIGVGVRARDASESVSADFELAVTDGSEPTD
ncbi:hypothetical protein [Halalkalicoccus sp. NIPERK01]|uniref:hypothetical protein n=1 Tax=Halalkalicoccus sp. NIPERK01 TaxID=3053469 RepID=UPI00256EF074|nr:hypothetical protein [Halalkalicoccus sp. NIPERK01]MDL5361951.1 hypothetical protein [Halalkalicoccus sp. NIPERK01]